MTSEPRKGGAVYWLSDTAKRLLRYETQMQRVAATPVDDPDEWRLPPVVEPPMEHETPEPAGPPFPATPPAMLGQIFPFPSQEGATPPYMAADRSVVDTYHDDAVAAAGVHWCRVQDCFHRAPADGDVCPVCKDKGIKAIFGEGDAA
jgi:hypothetical protein